jgi:hypothetical protein
MTHNIIAIDENELHCSECGNDKPEKFRTITKPHIVEGQLQGYTLSGVTCMRCETNFSFEHDLRVVQIDGETRLSR